MRETSTRTSAVFAAVALPWLSLGGALPAAAQVPVATGAEFQVNSYTTLNQRYPVVASDPVGNFVVVWTSDGSSGGDTSSYSIQGQRYAADGSARGSQFQINTYTTSSQFLPSVASTLGGGFVVAWQSGGSPGTDTDWSIQARRYDSSGTALGAQFQVNTYTTNPQQDPSVAADHAGNFVVAWTSYGSSGNDNDFSIQARRYDSNGSPLGSEFQVNTYTTSMQAYPSVASDSPGNFVVAWQSNGSAGTDTSHTSIHARRYDSSGAAQGDEFQVNTYTSNYQIRPSVASDAEGDFVVAWVNGQHEGDQSVSIRARRFNSSGAAQGDEFEVETYTTTVPTGVGDVSVAADPTGEFTVTWGSSRSPGGDDDGSVQGRRFASDGAPVGDQFQINTYTPNVQWVSSVAADASQDLVVVWEGGGSAGSDNSNTSIHAQRYSAFVLGSQFQVNTYTAYGQFAPAVASGPTGEFVVVWDSYGSSGSDSSSTSIQGQRYGSDGTPQGSEFQVNTYTSGDDTYPAVAMGLSGNFVVVWQGSALKAQRFASDGVAQGSEFQVNTLSAGLMPSVATDPAGEFVVVWESTTSAGTDHNGYSIQGQRFASDGSAQGSQFQVNTYTTGYQRNPSVAMNGVGDFVVAWQSPAEGSLSDSWGIRGRRFASDGTSLDVQEFQVNTYTTKLQDYPSVASDFAGHFVVVWQSDGSSGTDTSNKSIQGQRYASDGSPLGGEFQVNSYTTNFQYRPAVARSGAGGEFVVTWHSRGSFGSDTDATSIQAQRYAADGSPIGGEFQVDSFTTGAQRNPAVAMDATGSSFMVAWESQFSPGSDNSNYSIQGQRFVPEPDATLVLGAGIALLFALRRPVARMRLGVSRPR